MAFDYSKLVGRIKEKCGTQDNFAAELGIGRVSLSRRLNNWLDFDATEIRAACTILDIPETEVAQYFFCVKSSETRT